MLWRLSVLKVIQCVCFLASSRFFSDLLDPNPLPASAPQLWLPGDLNRPLEVYIPSQHQPSSRHHCRLPLSVRSELSNIPCSREGSKHSLQQFLILAMSPLHSPWLLALPDRCAQGQTRLIAGAFQTKLVSMVTTFPLHVILFYGSGAHNASAVIPSSTPPAPCEDYHLITFTQFANKGSFFHWLKIVYVLIIKNIFVSSENGA